MSSFPHHYSTMNAMNAPNPPLHYPVKPVGVFWDIENCPVPKTNNASSVIHFIRSFFVVNRLHHREFDFLVACDVTKIKKSISDEINKAGGVTLAHVSGTSKNAADEKLRESMRKFMDTHGSTTPTLVLISGDIDFVNDLRGYQTRLGCSIIVIHGVYSSQHFITGWNEIYPYDTFLSMMGGASAPSLVAPAISQQGPPRPNNFKKNQSNGQGPKPNPGGYQGRQSQRGNDNKKKNDNNQNQHNKEMGQQGMGPQGMGRNRNANKPDSNEAQASNVNAGCSSGAFQKKNIPRQQPGRIDTGGAMNQNRKRFGQGNVPQNQEKDTVVEDFVCLDQMSLGGAASKPQREPKEKKEFILMVTGLPGKMDYHILKDNLQVKASQVRGSVKFVKNGQGFISFKKKEHADNAIAIFNGMDVFGKKLNVHYCQKIPFDNPKSTDDGESKGESNLDTLAKAQKVGEEIGKLIANTKNSECCIQ